MKYPDFDGTQSCASVDTDVFFAMDPDEPGAKPANFNEARAICYSCSWQVRCLDYALSEPSLLGVWGGLSERERSRFRGRHRVSA